ncbi:hypothetical protein QT381_15035 [Galbitalea sp. SE-J8]|uniref:hypothetical protein n=1 Tax=Galbitalea sp. SE-J8 TaxID=3054952 RepID=UPI00259CB87E|nr:hypothetical protein [Galbitalea sp. SE-J8]MDM4764318.1 hypothetical protein [Galbitalea sp. SE-J8]
MPPTIYLQVYRRRVSLRGWIGTAEWVACAEVVLRAQKLVKSGYGTYLLQILARGK